MLSWAGLLLIIGVMTGVWLVSVRLRDASLIDPFWGLGFVLLAWFCWWQAGETTPRGWLLLALVTIWGTRLTLYLFWRRRGQGEDRRYAAMRQRQGARFWWVSLFTVFWLQAVLLWFVAWPVQVGVLSQELRPWTVLDGVGLAVWLIGFLFETIGDWQLASFLADPGQRGRVLQTGLWRYTRHPNYFGDFCVWWGLFLIAWSGGAYWTIGSPLLMSLLLMRVSGVGLLEQSIGERRPEYAEYRARTNAFFPGPRRSA